jgi:hypothetical protein
MDRLKDLVDTSDAATALAAKLLKSTRATTASAASRESVRAAVATRAQAGLTFRAKLLLATTPIVISVGVAGYLSTRNQPVVVHAASSSATVHEEPKADIPSPASESGTWSMPAEEIRRTSHHHRAATRLIVATPQLTHEEEADNRESMLLVEAGERLRRRHDAAGARDLVASYLQRFPDGILVEEAFAIALEAAAVEPDADRDRRTANEYLRRFPQGRFRDVADRVLARTGR